MKYVYILLSILLFSSNGIIKAQDSISITQCYALARANYPQIHQHRLIDQAEQYRLSNLGKNWLPHLTVQANASYQSEVTQLPFNGQQLSSLMPGMEIPVLNKDRYQVTAQLDQTLWDGGNTRSTKTLTRMEAAAKREALESELYALNDQVNQLYFGCLLQNELLRQNRLLQKDLQTHIQRIQSMMQHGTANQSDLESIQVELLKTQQKEIELQASEQAFRQMLGSFINRPISEKTLLQIPTIPENRNTSLINRPELRSLEAQQRFWQTRNQQLTAGLMPQFSAFIQGGYGRPALNMLSNNFDGFYVAGIRLSWSLGKLYTLKNDRKEIDTHCRNIDLQKETFLFNTRLKLIQHDLEIQKMTEVIQTDEKIIQLRSNIKKAAEVKLENGVITVTDLIREINAEDLSRQTAATHRIQLLISIYSRIHTTN